MFQNLIDELKRLQKESSISVTILPDSEGYLDRECPSKICLSRFKIIEEDWIKSKIKESVFCPFCRHSAPHKSWFTSNQANNIHSQAKNHILGRIGNAIEDGARDFNAEQSNHSFLRMSISVSGTRPTHCLVPVSAESEMATKITCTECETRFAVIGSAYFCPCCGYNSVEETFDNSIKKIESKIKNIPAIQKAVEAISLDEANITCKSLIETSLNDGVVAFQRYCEKTFSKLAPDVKIKHNAFQNLEIGGKYWENNFEKSYSDWLTPLEFSRLNILFQRRHLLSHTEGIVDQKYLDKSSDGEYIVDQRIKVSESDILEMLSLISIVKTQIRKL
jgi:uncharacterized Zn finger protein (UPF0148 family)